MALTPAGRQRKAVRAQADAEVQAEAMQAEGAALLDELHEALKRYVIFPSGHASAATTLWIAATHALPAFECAPRLVVTSPSKRCGKTRLLDMIDATSHRPLANVTASVAALFRSIGRNEHPPTLIIDEADTIFGRKTSENNEDLRALLNAGHQRGKTALRCVGPTQTPPSSKRSLWRRSPASEQCPTPSPTARSTSRWRAADRQNRWRSSVVAATGLLCNCYVND